MNSSSNNVSLQEQNYSNFVKQGSIGNWLQCREPIQGVGDGDQGNICGKWRSYGLEKEFREDLFEDFEQFTLDSDKDGNLYVLEKYWAFHHYGETRGQTGPLKEHPELDKLLREEFRSLDDFNHAKTKNNVTP